MPDVRSLRELNLYVNRRTGLAVKNAAKILTEQLRNIVPDHYSEKYKSSLCKRTEKLLNSVVYDMLDGNTASIGIRKESRNNRDSSARKLRGSVSDYIEDGLIDADGNAWSGYEDWCEKNVPKILKSELQKRSGLAVK